jgi:hypothetical protein
MSQHPKKVEVCDAYKEIYQRYFNGIESSIRLLETLLNPKADPRATETLEQKLSNRPDLTSNLELIESITHILAEVAGQLQNNLCVDLEDSFKLAIESSHLLRIAQSLRQKSVERDALKKLEKDFTIYTQKYKTELSSAQFGFEQAGQEFIKVGKKVSTLFEKLIPPAERVRVKKVKEEQHQELTRAYEQFQTEKSKEKKGT